MTRSLIAFTGAASLVALTAGVLAESPSYSKTYEKYVQPDGTITVPQDYRTKFIFIGTFSVAGGDQRPGTVPPGLSRPGLRRTGNFRMATS
ncbi:MAG: hypothetical protein PHO08_12660 [Methylococcales bacterium]|nr:hypothetical protein [Methylococcales bacterium]